MCDNIGTIEIGKNEATVDLAGLAADKVKFLRIYSRNKKANLDFLSKYSNVETLFINGEIGDVDGISELKQLTDLKMILSANVDLSKLCVPALKSLSVYNQINTGFSSLMTDKIEYLEIMQMRRLSDLSFLENAVGLKKLYLMSLPAVEKLPDFSKLPNLFALKIYELHKLNDIESLTHSSIRFLLCSLSADKLSGTRIAEVLLRTEKLEKADMAFLDRSNMRRSNALEKQMARANKEELLKGNFDFDQWKRLKEI
ncbi:MAG TPA: hypothetical protein DDX91_06290 [Ruminococcaceae bacterium]|nr:hypothetical protein [Oscillospiraceae bacterium]